MAQEENAGCPSELRLDRWLAGELEGTVAASVGLHVQACARCSARRQRRERERAWFRASAPPLFVVGPAVVPKRRRAIWWGAGALATAMAMLVLFVVPARMQHAGVEVTRAKGQQRMSFFVRDGVSAAVREGAPGEIVHPGDRLRFAFDREAVGESYAAVLSKDARQGVDVYFPPDGTQAARLGAADGLPPYSVALDVTLGTETLYAVFCPQRHPLDELRTALRAATPQFPADCAVERTTLEKRPRP